MHALRALNNYTSKEMADRLGISQGQYSKIESGKKEVSLEMLERISTALNIKLKDFMEMVLNDNGQNPVKIPNLTINDKPLFEGNLLALENIFHPKFIETCRLYLEYMNERQVKPDNNFQV